MRHKEGKGQEAQGGRGKRQRREGDKRHKEGEGRGTRIRGRTEAEQHHVIARAYQNDNVVRSSLISRLSCA